MNARSDGRPTGNWVVAYEPRPAIRDDESAPRRPVVGFLPDDDRTPVPVLLEGDDRDLHAAVGLLNALEIRPAEELEAPAEYELAVVADLLAEIPRRLIEHADLVVLNATQEVIKDRNGDEREVNRGEFTDLLTRARKVVWL